MTGKVLILAPRGRDADVASSLLTTAGMHSYKCSSLQEFVNLIDDAAQFAVLTEEALRGEKTDVLRAKVADQPAWSDFQFIVLTTNSPAPEKTRAAAVLSGLLRNVSFLERPFHPTSFVSLAKTAQQGRNRQFEAKARLEELRESQLRLVTALSAGRLGAWELDLTTQTLTTTPTCRSIFGYGPDEPFGYDDLLTRIHPEDLSRMRAAVGSSVETGADYSIEYRTIWRDGSAHWVAINARILNHGTERAQLVGVSADITDRRQAEIDLKSLNENLEVRVANRTSELEAAHQAVLSEIAQREKAEKELRQVQKVEMIGQLTGGVAHDFNNLLMAVLGNLEILRKHLPQDLKMTRLLDGAMQGAQRGAALTKRLLAFARRQDLVIRPASITDLVSHMSDLLDKSVGQNIERKTFFADNVPLALVDENQVELALLNLVINSRDAMPNGGIITIKVVAASVAEPGDLPVGSYVRLSVTDTGHGMDQETLNKATEPFYSTKELGKGTGLGLSMVHGLAKQLKGNLRLISEVGRGTTAELWLPATTGNVAAAGPEPLPQPVEHHPSKATILIVDDDVLIAMSAVTMVEDLGHEAVEVHSGADALKILDSGARIDLLITDFSMPKMNGAELVERARQARPGLPIILATGYAELPEGRELGVPRLSKPYLQRQLAAEIEKALLATVI